MQTQFGARHVAQGQSKWDCFCRVLTLLQRPCTVQVLHTKVVGYLSHMVVPEAINTIGLGGLLHTHATLSRRRTTTHFADLPLVGKAAFGDSIASLCRRGRRGSTCSSTNSTISTALGAPLHHECSHLRPPKIICNKRTLASYFATASDPT